MTPATDAAILYLAANATAAPLTCRHVLPASSTTRLCGAPMVGVSDDDGAPLCAEHLADPEERGHLLSAGTMAEILRMHGEANRE